MNVKVIHNNRRENDGFIYIKILYKEDDTNYDWRTYPIYCENVEAKMDEYSDPESGLMVINREKKLFVAKCDYELYMQSRPTMFN